MLERNAAATQKTACAENVCGPQRKVRAFVLWRNLAASMPFANFALAARAHMQSCTQASVCISWVLASNGVCQGLLWPSMTHFGLVDT